MRAAVVREHGALDKILLEDDFPEIVHSLMDLIFPHYLRPIPSTSIIVFSPKPGLKETITVPRGTAVASIPVEGTTCLFKTCFDVEAHPLRVTDARVVQEPGRAVQIVVDLELTGAGLSAFAPRTLRFFLGGDYAEAANLYMLLNRHVRGIVLRPRQGGRQLTLPPDFLRPGGFLLWLDLALPKWVARLFRPLVKKYGLYCIAEVKSVFEKQGFKALFDERGIHGPFFQHHVVWQKVR